MDTSTQSNDKTLTRETKVHRPHEKMKNDSDAVQLKKKQNCIRIVYSSLIIIALIYVFTIYILPFKTIDDFLKREYSISFYDNEDKLLQVTSIQDGIRREYTPLKEINTYVTTSFIKAEDSRFFIHNGIDRISIVRATIQNIKASRTISGASTISMQLAKIMNKRKATSYIQKIQDALTAIQIEKRFSKIKILELYLNNIPFGNNIEGVTSASRYYFKKELNELSKEESMLLAIIPRRPAFYNPIINPEKTALQASRIFKIDYEKLIASSPSKTPFKWPFHFPHLINEVKKQTKNEKNKVYLTVNLELEKFSEYTLKQTLNETKKSRINNAALIVIQNSTGNILCWCGSNDWFDKEHSGQIDGVLVKNQMGSSMKPFLYAMAIENNTREHYPYNILQDIPLEYGTNEIYLPQNFNNRYNGPVLFRTSLASSLNVPAVKLLSQITVQKYLEKLYALGFESLKEDGLKADLGLALGAGEVTLLELTNAFTVFPNDGKLIKASYFQNKKTNNKQKGNSVYNKDTARIICDILSDKNARASGFGYLQTYQTSYPSIFKTGTANQYQNIVALGATPKYTVGVWMGNFSGNTVIGKTGSSLPAYCARTILDFLTNEEKIEFTKPENYTKIEICTLSGKYPSKNCIHTIEEYIENERLEEIKQNECDWHRTDNEGKTTVYYPAEYQQWLTKNKNNYNIDYATSPLTIETPKDGSIFYHSTKNPEQQKIPVSVTGGYNENITNLTVYYDTIEISKQNPVYRPYNFTLPVEKGKHTLKVMHGTETQTITFEVK